MLFILVGLCVFLLIVLLCVFTLLLSELSVFSSSREESSSFECGFEHNSLSRVPFSLRYFLLTLVFLIFDIEIMYLIITPYLLYSFNSNALLLFLVLFIVVLLIGLIYEWLDGSLDWVI